MKSIISMFAKGMIGIKYLAKKELLLFVMWISDNSLRLNFGKVYQFRNEVGGLLRRLVLLGDVICNDFLKRRGSHQIPEIFDGKTSHPSGST